MVYYKLCDKCKDKRCRIYAMHIKLQGKWLRVGWFHTLCKRIFLDIPNKNKELIREFNHSFKEKERKETNSNNLNMPSIQQST